jgi:hypothetical protein
MAFAFLLVILPDRGKEITKNCFQEEDAPEPNFDWMVAPGMMDYNNVYHPPVLAEVNLQSDDESNDSSYSSSSSSKDKDLTGAKVDDDGVAILPPQESSDDEFPAPKKKDEKKPVKMTCSR